MFNKGLIIVLLCLSYVHWTHQSRHRNFDDNNVDESQKEGYVKKNASRVHLTSCLIIVGCILLLLIFLYGTRCFYVIKMHFFEKKEKLYTKMDLTSQV